MGFSFNGIVNQKSTTLAVAMTASVPANGGTLDVVDGSVFPGKGYALVDNEILHYDSVSGSTLTLNATDGRASGGTTAAPHALASTIYADVVVAAHINELADASPEVFDVCGPSFGAKADGAESTDDRGPIQNAIDAATAAGGGIVLFPPARTFRLRSGSLKLPPNLIHPLILSGYGATIKLTTNAPGFLTVNKIADHDTFQNIRIEGFTVDADNLAISGPVIFGTMQGADPLRRINLHKIVVRDVTAINIPPADPTGATNTQGILLYVRHDSLGEATQNYIKDILIENVRVEGGNSGVMVAAKGGPMAAGINIFLDNIHIHRCYHDSGITPANYLVAANYQVGSLGFGGNVHISDCVGIGSGDVGIEVNGFTHGLIENCHIRDAFNIGLLHTNFNNPEHPKDQEIIFRDCKVERAAAAEGTGALVRDSFSVPLGRVVFENLSVYENNVPLWGAALNVSQGNGNPTDIREVVVRGFTHVVENLNFTRPDLATLVGVAVICKTTPTTMTRLHLEDLVFRYSGQRTGAGMLAITPLSIYGGPFTLDLDGMTVAAAVTNIGPWNKNLIVLGAGSGSSGQGTIRRYHVQAISDGGYARAAYIHGPDTFTISNQLRFEDCDFSGLDGGTSDIGIEGGNVANVVYDGVKWKTFPPPAVAITVGAPSPYIYRNLDGYRETVVVSGGTVTSPIELSRNGTNFYPTGLTAGAFPLNHGDYLKVTYTSAPTMTKIPEA